MNLLEHLLAILWQRILIFWTFNIELHKVLTHVFSVSITVVKIKKKTYDKSCIVVYPRLSHFIFEVKKNPFNYIYFYLNVKDHIYENFLNLQGERSYLNIFNYI